MSFSGDITQTVCDVGAVPPTVNRCSRFLSDGCNVHLVSQQHSCGSMSTAACRAPQGQSFRLSHLGHGILKRPHLLSPSATGFDLGVSCQKQHFILLYLSRTHVCERSDKLCCRCVAGGARVNNISIILKLKRATLKCNTSPQQYCSESFLHTWTKSISQDTRASRGGTIQQ